MLVIILIILFSILLFTQISHKLVIVEGLDTGNNNNATYNNYGSDPLILGKQNAGNIEYLKEQIKDLPDIRKQISELITNVDSLNKQMDEMAQQQNKALSDVGGKKPLDVSGI